MAHYPKIFDFTNCTPIDACEIVWGTGGGITSSNYFVFDCSRINLVMGGASSLNSATNSVFLSSIIGGYCNSIISSTSSSILGGASNSISESCSSSVVGGNSNTLSLRSCNSSMVGGNLNIIASQSCHSSIIAGCRNLLYYVTHSSIVSGSCNTVGCNSNYSSIVSGTCNTLNKAFRSSIIGGFKNTLSNYSNYSSIVGGCGGEISCSRSSVILGGVYGDEKSYGPPTYGKSFGNKIIGGGNNLVSGGFYSKTYDPYSYTYIRCNYPNRVYYSCSSTILGGRGNSIYDSNFSSILGSGTGSFITQSNYGTILGSRLSNISSSTSSTILSSFRSYIYNSLNSFVVGGVGDTEYSYHPSGYHLQLQTLICGGCNNIITGGINYQAYYCVNLPNRIHHSCSSAIIGGGGNRIGPTNSIYGYTNKSNVILGSRLNCMGFKENSSSCYNSFISSNCMYLYDAQFSSSISSWRGFIAGSKNITLNSLCTCMGGNSNTIMNSNYSKIFGCNSSIIGSLGGFIQNGLSNVIIASTVSGNFLNAKNLINNSNFSGLILSKDGCISATEYSSIISSCDSRIIGFDNLGSCTRNSVIIGGKGLCIGASESDVVYLSTLKIQSVTQSIDSLKVLTWDSDKCVRYSTINAEGAIRFCEIAWGTGTGITSSNFFKFDCSGNNLMMGCEAAFATPIFTHASASNWSINLGLGRNCIDTSTSSVIMGGCEQLVSKSNFSSILGGNNNTIYKSDRSSTLGGKFLTITQSNYSTIINGSASCIVSSNYSTIIGGVSDTRKSIVKDSTSSLILNSSCFSLIGTSSCSMIANALCSKIENSKGSLILGGSCDCIVNQSYRSVVFGIGNIIDNSKDSIVFGHRNNCICNNSYCSIILSGCLNVIINNSSDSIIVQGCNNCLVNSAIKTSIITSEVSKIDNSCLSTIISTTNSTICGSEYNMIQGSVFSKSCNNCISSIISTKCSCIIGKPGTKDYSFDIILGGCCHTIATSSLSSIIGGYKNTINRGNCNSSIISSCCSFIQFNTEKSSIIGGENNAMVLDVCNSNILGGMCECIFCSKFSLIGSSTQSCIRNSCASINLGGYRNTICFSKSSIILGSVCGFICDSCNSSDIGSYKSEIKISDYSFIIGSFKSCICDSSCRSSIISSCNSFICGSTNSVIIGGTDSSICTSQNSAIIGGRGLTLSNENQVVYIPELKINKVDQCVTLSKFLVWDDTNKYVRWANSALEPGVTGSTIFYTGTNWTYSSTNIYNNGTYVGIGLTNSLTNTYATPSSNLHVFGSLSLDVKTASTNYTLTDRNFTLLAYPTSAGMTVSLPQASLAKNRVYVIKRVQAGGEVRINPFAGDNIEGYGSYITLDTQWDYNILQSDGVLMWIKLGGAVGLNLA